jgi:outer membrane murein-binding lipoprotein Lpp
MRCSLTVAARACWPIVLSALLVAACTPREQDTTATPLPTRQTTIDPVKAKLDAAQQDAERRRSEAERAGQ